MNEPALPRRLIELAQELESELDGGAKWTKAQHTCESVAGVLRDLATRGAPVTPAPAEPVATPFGKTPQQHLDDAVKWLDTRRDRLHHEGCSVHEPSARCNCGLHKALTDVRAVRNWLETQPAPTCDECGKSKADGWALYCVACAESALAAPPATPAAQPAELPPLPKATGAIRLPGGFVLASEGYTAEQMTAYALAAITRGA